MFFSVAPPTSSDTISILYIIVPSAISLLVGLMTGGMAGYIGLKRLRMDTEAHKNDAEAQKISTSNMLINDALALVNSMRDEVTHRGEENAHLRTENEQLKTELEKYHKHFEAATAGEKSEPSEPKS